MDDKRIAELREMFKHLPKTDWGAEILDALEAERKEHQLALAHLSEATTMSDVEMAEIGRWLGAEGKDVHVVKELFDALTAERKALKQLDNHKCGVIARLGQRLDESEKLRARADELLRFLIGDGSTPYCFRKSFCHFCDVCTPEPANNHASNCPWLLATQYLAEKAGK